MCIAIPGTIINIEDMIATVDYGGVCKKANLRLVENAAPGDIVLVHADFVIRILDKEYGEELQRLVEEAMRLI